MEFTFVCRKSQRKFSYYIFVNVKRSLKNWDRMSECIHLCVQHEIQARVWINETDHFDHHNHILNHNLKINEPSRTYSPKKILHRASEISKAKMFCTRFKEKKMMGSYNSFAWERISATQIPLSYSFQIGTIATTRNKCFEKEINFTNIL